MVGVKSKSYSHQGCTKHPMYGVDDDNRKAEYCALHAKDGMVGVKSNNKAGGAQPPFHFCSSGRGSKRRGGELSAVLAHEAEWRLTEEELRARRRVELADARLRLSC